MRRRARPLRGTEQSPRGALDRRAGSGRTLLRALLAIVTAACALPATVRAGDAKGAALAQVATGLDPAVLALALRASACAAHQGVIAAPQTLTVIDYSRPSTEARLWVLDLTRGVLVYRERVAHGRGSGDLLATRFSNDAGSQQSSLGLFVTLEVYDGRHGRSLRLRGLESGINDRALDRALVMHGADYASAAFAARYGRLGRSHGCPALAFDVAQPVIDTIRGGTPLFAYYPDAPWLEGSPFLQACGEGHPGPSPSRTAPPAPR